MFALKVYLVTLKVIHFDLSYLPRHTRLRDETEKMKEGYTSRALDHQGHTPDIHFQVISPNLNHWHHCRHTSQLLVTAGFIWKERYSENSQIAQNGHVNLYVHNTSSASIVSGSSSPGSRPGRRHYVVMGHLARVQT